jgi:nicotinate-nucleotide pyrophosphorylase (carboxylating)
MNLAQKFYCKKIIDLALEEDLQKDGDITSKSIIDDKKIVEFYVNTRQPTISCTQPVADILLKDANIDYQVLQKDGNNLNAGQTIIIGRCKALDILRIERVFLNFIQHMCGVASITRQFVEKVAGTKAIIRDTRKTIPGLRYLQKYAVSVGGGQSYRYSLSDNVLIKDNHIASCGGIESAIKKLTLKLQKTYIAVECDNTEQVKIALGLGVDMILLDNMQAAQIKNCVELAKSFGSKTKLEASGSVTLQNIAEIAATGVDYISVGQITHSVQSADIGIDIN